MRRRTFLQLLGLAPAAAVLPKLGGEEPENPWLAAWDDQERRLWEGPLPGGAPIDEWVIPPELAADWRALHYRSRARMGIVAP